MKKQFILLICFLVATHLLNAQNLEIAEGGFIFDGQKYSENEFNIEIQFFRLDSVTVEIVQIIRKEFAGDDFNRRAIIKTKENDIIIDELYFKDMEPVGSWGGICFTQFQPNPNYIIGSKYGDYDGRIIIINKLGEIIDKPGGNFFITDDQRFLISDWYSDLSGITVFDFETGEIVCSKKVAVYHSKWYKYDDKYYTVEWKNNTEGNVIYEFNLNDFTFKPIDLNINQRDQFKQVTNLACSPD